MSSMTNTLAEPAVSDCPAWCELPAGHGWTDRHFNEYGDRMRAHDHMIDAGVFIRQYEAFGADGRVTRDPVDVYSREDRDDCMTPDEALMLAAELERRAAFVRQAAELARRVSA